MRPWAVTIYSNFKSQFEHVENINSLICNNVIRLKIHNVCWQHAMPYNSMGAVTKMPLPYY